MGISRSIFICWLVIVAILLGVPSVGAQSDTVLFECTQSFEYFAYGIQEDITEADQLDIVWVPQYELPETDESSGRTLNYYATRVLLSHIVDGDQEIWLGLDALPNVYGEPVFGKYRVNEDSLTIVPRRLGDFLCYINSG
jgi:hypothetical protein